MTGKTFSIAEQSFSDSEHGISIKFASDPADYAKVTMEIPLDEGNKLRTTFNRNGSLLGSEVIEKPAPAEPAPAEEKPNG